LTKKILMVKWQPKNVHLDEQLDMMERHPWCFIEQYQDFPP
jgi:hypothetical protein